MTRVTKHMAQETLEVTPLSLPFDITLTMPGSKSHANRAIIAACLTEGTTTIDNATPCDDVMLLVENLTKMGFRIEWKNRQSGTLTIQGGIPQRELHATSDQRPALHCGNAGTTLRFLTSLACLVPGEWNITGNEHMLHRPIGDLVTTLRTLGAEITDTQGCPPIVVQGGTLKGGIATLDASKSSQFLTSLLLIGPLLERRLTITITSTLASPPYVELTRKVMGDFGVTVVQRGTSFSVPHRPYISPRTYTIEGDWSAAGAFLVLAELTKSRINFMNLDPKSQQGDRELPSIIKEMHKGGNLTINCNNIPDQVMNLAILAAKRKGTTTITGAANLRLKECDRLAVLTQELQKAGIDIREHPDGVIVMGNQKPINQKTQKPIGLDPHDDHRMVMAFAILGSMREGIRIKNPSCVSKSYPHFFQDLEKLQRSSRCIAIIGMRGCGKSNLAKRLASKLVLKRIDTDSIFKKQYGTIDTYVAKHGWPAFRREEERIVAENLKPGHAVSLGGGAIESAATRKLLMENAIVIWMQASWQMTVARLKKSKRPALTTLPLKQEVQTILRKRDPFYRSASTITLPERMGFSRQASFLIDALKELCSW